MQDLRVTIVQSELHWEQVDANLEMFSNKLHSVSDTDLIVLPEMFTTGFSMNSTKLAEPMNGKSMQWMQQVANNKNAVVCGSLIITENNNYYNRFIWMQSDGTYQTYDKKHLFRMANEQHHFTAGTQKTIIKIKGWKICPMICYDLRFPVWSRRVENTNEDYDLLLYVANWPEKRNHAWQSLLPARAIENMSYVVGVNRVGADANSLTYSGDSVVLNPIGEKLVACTPNQNEIETVTLKATDCQKFRNKLPFNQDADKFELK
jgi:predicted amidohydrolase